MSRKILFYFIVIATFLSLPVYAASYEDGQAAYEARDYKKAAKIWEALAEQGDINSQLKIAGMYSSGVVFKRDIATAIELYNQAVEQGSAEAMFELGQIYMHGHENSKPDQDKGRELYLEAANRGYAKAQYYYGITYFRGEGVLTDYVQGHAWMYVSLVNGYDTAKQYIEVIEDTLSEADLKKSKDISDKLLAEIK